ncbi:hypothetical protein [Streptomyces atratus]|uniref:hypothetical protein n=1 Tax=Streptomyces atratus TaxID=1893 RepID=UPI0018E5893E|nr:hypothetical protein [Streptomyces atratus]
MRPRDRTGHGHQHGNGHGKGRLRQPPGAYDGEGQHAEQEDDGDDLGSDGVQRI